MGEDVLRAERLRKKRRLRVEYGAAALLVLLLFLLGWSAFRGISKVTTTVYSQATSPDGQCTAYSFVSGSGLNGTDGPLVTVMPAGEPFEPGDGEKVLELRRVRYVDVEWEDNSHLVVTCRGDRASEENIEFAAARINVGRPIEVRHQFLQSMAVSEVSFDLYTLDRDETLQLLVTHRPYGSSGRTVTEVLAARKRGNNTVPPQDSDPILILNGEHRVTVSWENETLTLHCPDTTRKDIMLQRHHWRGITVAASYPGSRISRL